MSRCFGSAVSEGFGKVRRAYCHHQAIHHQVKVFCMLQFHFPLLKEVHPFLRHGAYYTAIVDYIHALSRPMWFFDELDDTGREQHLEDIDFYVDIMSKRFTSLCEEREEDT